MCLAAAAAGHIELSEYVGKLDHSGSQCEVPPTLIKLYELYGTSTAAWPWPFYLPAFKAEANLCISTLSSISNDYIVDVPFQ